MQIQKNVLILSKQLVTHQRPIIILRLGLGLEPTYETSTEQESWNIFQKDASGEIEFITFVHVVAVEAKVCDSSSSKVP